MQFSYCTAVKVGRGYVAQKIANIFILERKLVHINELNRPLGRLRRRWKDNIKMDFQELGRGLWTGSSWLRIRTVGGNL